MIDKQFIKENILDSIGRLKYTKVKLVQIPEEFAWCNSKEEYIHAIWFDNIEPPKCVHCDVNLKYVGPFNKGYNKTCSNSCAGFVQINRGVPDQEKSKKTCLEKYGVENPFQSEKFKEKMKATKIEKYNDVNYNNRDKARETSLEKYGTDRPSQSVEVKAKIRNSNKNADLEVIEKKQKTCMKNYGRGCGFNKTDETYISDRGKATAKGLKKYYHSGEHKFRFIYVLSSDVLGMIKIGITKNISKRIATIRKGVSDARLISIHYYANTSDLEEYFHSKYDDYNVVLDEKCSGYTEWFSSNIITEVISELNEICKLPRK